jgi:hypothetical protein
MKNAAFWEVKAFGSCKKRHIGRTHRVHHHVEKNQRSRKEDSNNNKLLITANISNSLNISTLIMEAVNSSETSLFARATWHHIPEDGILL